MVTFPTDPEEIEKRVEAHIRIVNQYRLDRYDKFVQRMLEKPLPQDPQEALRQLAQVRHDLSKELRSGEDIQVD